MFSHCVHLKLGHRFHALLEVCSDRDDTVPLTDKIAYQNILLLWISLVTSQTLIYAF